MGRSTRLFGDAKAPSLGNPVPLKLLFAVEKRCLRCSLQWYLCFSWRGCLYCSTYRRSNGRSSQHRVERIMLVWSLILLDYAIVFAIRSSTLYLTRNSELDARRCVLLTSNCCAGRDVPLSQTVQCQQVTDVYHNPTFYQGVADFMAQKATIRRIQKRERKMRAPRNFPLGQ